MRTPPIVCVEWDDAWSDKHAVREGDDNYKRGYTVMAAGFLQDEEDRIVICRAWAPGHSDEGPHFSDCISIPRSLVVQVRRVRTWQDHELPPLAQPGKPAKRRRRRKARPPTEAPPAALSTDSDGVAPPESTTPPEEGE